jgi:hypothetical protein
MIGLGPIEGQDIGRAVVGEGDPDRIGEREQDEDEHGRHAGEDVAVDIGLFAGKDVQAGADQHQRDQREQGLALGIHHHHDIEVDQADQPDQAPFEPVTGKLV